LLLRKAWLAPCSSRGGEAFAGWAGC
jgi:hypothetical protein